MALRIVAARRDVTSGSLERQFYGAAQGIESGRMAQDQTKRDQTRDEAFDLIEEFRRLAGDKPG